MDSIPVQRPSRPRRKMLEKNAMLDFDLTVLVQVFSRSKTCTMTGAWFSQVARPPVWANPNVETKNMQKLKH